MFDHMLAPVNGTKQGSRRKVVERCGYFTFTLFRLGTGPMNVKERGSTCSAPVVQRFSKGK
jgi:hypothetical protein